MTVEPLNIMIIDDNDVYREFLSDIVAEIDGAILVAAVSGGRTGLARLKHFTVDVVLLDIEMPGMDGLEVLERIRLSHPETGVVMMSAFYHEGTDKVVEALEMGALDFISKSDTSGETDGISVRRRLKTLLGLFRARRNIVSLTRERQRNGTKTAESDVRVAALKPQCHCAPPPPFSFRASPGHSKIDLVAIGISTGGPYALTKVIPALPADIGVPILIVQHMPAFMTAILAENLDKKSLLRVLEAKDGDEIEPNTVYIAPGGRHMAVVRKRSATGGTAHRRIRIHDGAPVNSCRPSVDVLLESLAEIREGGVLAIIMTGMGNDGVEGVKRLKLGSCRCISQNEESCVVYGMPRMVDEAGLSDESVHLDGIAERICFLVKNRDAGKGESTP